MGGLKIIFSAYNPDCEGENKVLSLPCEITPKEFKRSEFHWGQKTGFCSTYLMTFEWVVLVRPRTTRCPFDQSLLFDSQT
jgi:hypothetical protein